MPRRTVTDLLYSIQKLGLEAKLIKHERHDDAIDLDTSFRSMDEQVDFVLEQVERVKRESK